MVSKTLLVLHHMHFIPSHLNILFLRYCLTAWPLFSLSGDFCWKNSSFEYVSDIDLMMSLCSQKSWYHYCYWCSESQLLKTKQNCVKSTDSSNIAWQTGSFPIYCSRNVVNGHNESSLNRTKMILNFDFVLKSSKGCKKWIYEQTRKMRYYTL